MRAFVRGPRPSPGLRASAPAGSNRAFAGPSGPEWATSGRAPIGAPGDADERQADRIADRVPGVPEPASWPGAPAGRPAPRPGAPVAGARRQRRPIPSGEQVGAAVPPGLDRALASPGRPLDPAVRAFMEPRFGHDFGRVRVHADAAAAAS